MLPPPHQRRYRAMHRYDLIKFVRACGNEIKFLDIGDGEHTEE